MTPVSTPPPAITVSVRLGPVAVRILELDAESARRKVGPLRQFYLTGEEAERLFVKTQVLDANASPNDFPVHRAARRAATSLRRAIDAARLATLARESQP